jgi:YVTN family beta-propeller protein
MSCIGIRFKKLSVALLCLSAVLSLWLPTPAAHATPFAYITNNGSNNVTVIDTANNTVTATVAVGPNPTGVAVHPAGTRVYVANQSGNTLSVLDTASNTVIATVAVGAFPTGVAVNPAGTRVYVTNQGGNTLSVLDTANNTVIATVAVGPSPVGVAVDPAGNRIYVANQSANTVSVLDAASNTVSVTVTVGANPAGVVVNPAGTRVYVTNYISNSVSVIDTASNTVTATVVAGNSPAAFGIFIGGLPATAVAVEYYYAAWDFYFVTAFPDEIAALDGGAFGGVFQRTGQTFLVWPQTNPSASPTCRFFSTAFDPKSSHFYTPFAAECAVVKTYPQWRYEGIAFYIKLADANGLCSGGTIPLYRLYNNGMGGAPNHRYTISLTIFNQMLAAGWLFEGNGDTRVFACVPQ